MKTLLALIALSVSVFAGTPTENAEALNMTVEHYEFTMAMSGMLVGLFFNLVLWKVLP